MLGATEYSCAIDTWSMGCVLAELMTGRPLFAGQTSVDQLVKIIQVLGAPTKAQMNTMNQQYADFNFPDFKPKDWRYVIPDHDRIPQTAYDLLTSMLMFVPTERIAPYEVNHSTHYVYFRPHSGSGSPILRRTSNSRRFTTRRRPCARAVQFLRT